MLSLEPLSNLSARIRDRRRWSACLFVGIFLVSIPSGTAKNRPKEGFLSSVLTPFQTNQIWDKCDRRLSAFLHPQCPCEPWLTVSVCDSCCQSWFLISQLSLTVNAIPHHYRDAQSSRIQRRFMLDGKSRVRDLAVEKVENKSGNGPSMLRFYVAMPVIYAYEPLRMVSASRKRRRRTNCAWQCIFHKSPERSEKHRKYINNQNLIRTIFERASVSCVTILKTVSRQLFDNELDISVISWAKCQHLTSFNQIFQLYKDAFLFLSYSNN